MGSKEFLEKCKQISSWTILTATRTKPTKKQITEDDVFVVWYCKSLQNHKALLSTTVSDSMYYEITHNGDKQETYVDAYKKWENFVVKVMIMWKGIDVSDDQGAINWAQIPVRM